MNSPADFQGELQKFFSFIHGAEASFSAPEKKNNKKKYSIPLSHLYFYRPNTSP